MNTIKRLLFVLFSFITLNGHGAQRDLTGLHAGQKHTLTDETNEVCKKQKVGNSSNSSSSSAAAMDTDAGDQKSKKRSEFVEAIAQKNLNRIQELIGANPDFVDVQDGQLNTFLMLASDAGDTETVKLLIKVSANPFIENSDKETAQTIADRLVEECELVGLEGSDDHEKYSAIKDMLKSHAKDFAPKINKAIDEATERMLPSALVDLVGQYLTKNTQELPDWMKAQMEIYLDQLKAQGILPQDQE